MEHYYAAAVGFNSYIHRVNVVVVGVLGSVEELAATLIE